MAGITLAQADAVLKTLFDDGTVKYVGYTGHPLMAMLNKMEDFTGAAYKLPIHWGGHTGVSTSFSKAQANQARGRYDAFLLTRKNKYGLCSIQMESYESARAAGRGAFVNLLQEETEGTLRQVSSSIARSLYGNTGGAKGQVGGVSTTSLTLKNINDVVNFEVGEKITSSNTDGTSGSDDAQAIEITAINRETGVLTAAVTWTAGGNFSDNDYLFQEGDFGGAVAGLASWLPSTAPSATSFFGVDRSVDVTRLGGVRYDGSSDSIEEALQQAEVRLDREGGKPDICLMNNKDFGDFRLALGSRVVYDRLNSPSVAKVSFKAIVLEGIHDVKVVVDRDCPQGKAYMLTSEDWKLYSLGAAPRMFEHPNGNGDSLIVYNDDAVEFRMGARYQLGCRAPGRSAVITLPS